MAPEEPTRAPVTISAMLPSVKPMPAAAQPEYELSIDMTTGMSAPPIGMMMRMPNSRAAAVIAQNNAPSPPDWQNQTISTTVRPASARLIRCRAGRMIGLPDMRPLSLAKAITEPVKVMAPMATPSDISMRLAGAMLPGVPMWNASGA